MSKSKLKRQNHPLFDARLMYQLLELEQTLKLLVQEHNEQELDTDPYSYVLDAVQNCIPLIKDQFELKAN